MSKPPVSRGIPCANDLAVLFSLHGGSSDKHLKAQNHALTFVAAIQTIDQHGGCRCAQFACVKKQENYGRGVVIKVNAVIERHRPYILGHRFTQTVQLRQELHAYYVVAADDTSRLLLQQR